MTVDELYSLLVPIAGRWKQLSRKMGLDQEYINFVETTNKTEQSRLLQLVRDHSCPRTIGMALLGIKETNLAEKCGVNRDMDINNTKKHGNYIKSMSMRVIFYT